MSPFYKDSWNIIQDDIVEEVCEFFKKGRMLKAWNNIVITIIPKSEHVERVGDYRPIACCNTTYKVISKVLYNRLKQVMPHIISGNQSANL